MIICLCIFAFGQNDKYDYPGLGHLIESYYYSYYEYPNSICDLFRCNDFKNHVLGERYKETILKLKKNQNKIKWEKTEKELRIKLNDSILYYHKTNNDFCKELSSLWPEYLRKILFFDNDNCRIYDDDLKKLLFSALFWDTHLNS